MIEIIPCSQPLDGSVILPGSKSITNRALLLAALTSGKSKIRGALKSDDTNFMAAALRKLGIKIDEPNDTTFIVFGKNGKLTESDSPLFLGNAGTATRFLTAAAILVNGETTIDGDARMRKRPIGDLVDALRHLGAKIKYLKNESCLPLKIISNGKIKGNEVKIRGDISSQFVSALLMILPFAEQPINLKIENELTSAGYTEITKKVIASFSSNFAVEPDASSATYFWAAEKILKQKIKISNAPRNWIQPDANSQQIMEKFPQNFGIVDGSRFPDAIPTLAILAAFANGKTRFTDIKNLRLKECDRIHALATELNRIKAGLAAEIDDDLIIYGDNNLVEHSLGAEIETYNDHRIAMSFFLMGLKIPKIKIRNPSCVTKSFPNFWEVWENLGIKFLR